jgi:tetratricopeptide (TPR) repeat protein
VAFFGTKPQVADFLRAMPPGDQIEAWKVAQLRDTPEDEVVESIARVLTREPGLGMFCLIKDVLTFTRELASSKKSLRMRAADAWNRLGSALYHRNARGEAKAAFQRAIQQNPSFASAWYNLGVLFNDLGQKEEALYCFERAEAFKSPGDTQITLKLRSIGILPKKVDIT